MSQNPIFSHESPNDLPSIHQNKWDQFLVSEKPTAEKCLVVEVLEKMLKWALDYFAIKTIAEVKHFVNERKYVNI